MNKNPRLHIDLLEMKQRHYMLLTLLEETLDKELAKTDTALMDLVPAGFNLPYLTDTFQNGGFVKVLVKHGSYSDKVRNQGKLTNRQVVFQLKKLARAWKGIVELIIRDDHEPVDFTFKIRDFIRPPQ
jgi:hypothetical protein